MIIDSHCHIDFKEFDSDRIQVLQRAEAAGVAKIIVPGVIQQTWQRIKTTCEQYPQLYPCYGLHPYYIEQHTENHLQALETWLSSNKAVAIGECGLDFFLKNLDRGQQCFYFEQQLELAEKFKLPVVIHARKSTETVIKAIKKRPGLCGMIHSYSGSYEQAVQLIELGFFLSFGGALTYDKATRLHKLVKSLPLSNILIETDAPDQPVANSKGQRNEPAFITDIATKIAKLHNTDFNEVVSITTENANKLFQLI